MLCRNHPVTPSLVAENICSFYGLKSLSFSGGFFSSLRSIQDSRSKFVFSLGNMLRAVLFSCCDLEFVFLAWLHHSSGYIHSPPAVCLLPWSKAGEELTQPCGHLKSMITISRRPQYIQVAMPCFPVTSPTLLPSVQHLTVLRLSVCGENTHAEGAVLPSLHLATVDVPSSC